MAVLPALRWMRWISNCISSRSFLSSAPKRLVHEQQRRLEDERARKSDPLLLAARKLAGEPFLQAPQSHELERSERPARRLSREA